MKRVVIVLGKHVRSITCPGCGCRTAKPVESLVYVREWRCPCGTWGFARRDGYQVWTFDRPLVPA